MRMQAFHLSTQGASHIRKNKECQDASDSCYTEDYAIAIVCDGHGGADYVRSAAGSSFACAAAKANIESFIKNVDEGELLRHHDRLLNSLEGSIISAWNESIYAHYRENPFTAEEISVLSERARRKYLQEERVESAYGTTLIAVAVTKTYWFGIHIGDGKCVAVDPDGRFCQPIPWDDKCFLNATTSICDSDALNRFRSFFSQKLPVAVFVGSDGVDDCFGDEKQLYGLYRTVLYSFSNTGFDAAVADLGDYLPRLSAKGSGDDVSVAAILDLDRIGEIEAVRDFDAEKEKARIEENALLAAKKDEEERRRIDAEYAERQRRKQQAEEAERQRRLAKEAERQRRLAEEAERQRRLAEEAERQRRLAEEAEQQRRLAYERGRMRHSGRGQVLKQCPRCGTPYYPDTNFCSRCGMPVSPGPFQSGQMQIPPQYWQTVQRPPLDGEAIPSIVPPPGPVPPAAVPPAEAVPAEVPPAAVPPVEAVPAEVPPAAVPPVEAVPAEVPPAAVPPVETVPAEAADGAPPDPSGAAGSPV